ncbi:hypothetical protein EMIT0P294_90215 [Pseudomonas sp. IT-P294]
MRLKGGEMRSAAGFALFYAELQPTLITDLTEVHRWKEPGRWVCGCGSIIPSTRRG